MDTRLQLWIRRQVAVHDRAQPNSPTRPGRPAPAPSADPVRAQPPPQDPVAPHDYLDVRTPSDTWKKTFKKEREPRPVEPSPYPPGRPRMKKTERRRETISIAMSQDEEKAIRQAAHTAGVSLSEWARTAMFKYMGKPVPARDTRVRDWDRIEEETGEKTKARK